MDYTPYVNSVPITPYDAPQVGGFFNPRETIPASHLGYHSNNRYDGFPPLMSDGRSIMASNRSEPLTHNRVLKEAGFTSNASYRTYMINNAKTILERDWADASTDTGYPLGGRFADEIKGTPILFDSVMDQRGSARNSDLKSLYLSREQLDARKVAPRI
jgi:hypothetical protein